MHKLNADVVAEAMRLVRNGTDYATVAATLGISKRSVLRYARKAGLTKPIAVVDLATLRSLAAEGVHQAEAARRMRVSRSVVYKACRKHGIMLTCGWRDPVEARTKATEQGRKCSAEEAAVMGWPEAKRRVQARVLTVLEYGPYTEKQTAAILGWYVNRHGQCTRLNVVLRELLALRLVQRTRVSHSWEYRVAECILFAREAQ